MRTALALATVLAAAAIPAAQVASASHADRLGPAGSPTTTAPFDQQFIDVMAAHHMMAIEMAKMAQLSATHPQLRALARTIVAAQSREIATFRRLRKRWYGSPQFTTYAMPAIMMRSMGMGPSAIAGLMNSSRFDYVFISGMIPHHAGAITMARWETQQGTHPLLRTLAAKIIRDQATEIGQMIRWRLSWYGS